MMKKQRSSSSLMLKKIEGKIKVSMIKTDLQYIYKLEGSCISITQNSKEILDNTKRLLKIKRSKLYCSKINQCQIPF